MFYYDEYMVPETLERILDISKVSPACTDKSIGCVCVVFFSLFY